LAQLRLGVLPLQVEVGHLTSKRDENTGQICKHKYNERIGTLCESDEVEDEIHFVCVCAICYMFNIISLSNEEYIKMGSEVKFVYMMVHECKILANYIEKAWERRQNSLYMATK
jgi:hypothetical protein